LGLVPLIACRSYAATGIAVRAGQGLPDCVVSGFLLALQLVKNLAHFLSAILVFDTVGEMLVTPLFRNIFDSAAAL
jgi:hypothetical protein